MQGVGGEVGNIVGVAVPAGQAVDPLAQQVAQRVPDLGRLTRVDKAAGELLGQVQALIRGAQQHRSAIARGVRLVEGHGRGPRKQGWKENTLSVILRHDGSPPVRSKSLWQLDFSRSKDFRH